MKLCQILEPGLDVYTEGLPVNRKYHAIMLGNSKGEIVSIPVIGVGVEVRAKKTAMGIVLVRGEFEPEDRCLATINTVGKYIKGDAPNPLNVEGIQVLASGRTTPPFMSPHGSGIEALAIVEAGATFTLDTGRFMFWYQWDGTSWTVEMQKNRDARLAATAAAEAGEWL